MSHKRYLLSTTAVLTGFTVLVGGVGQADAATTTPQTDTFSLSFTEFPTSTNESFQQFNPALGTLTSVDFSLDSLLSTRVNVTGSVSVDGVQLSSQTSDGGNNDYDATFSGISGAANAAFYTGTSTFNAVLSLTAGSNASWTGNGDYTGLTLTYDYTPVSTTPLPATLPLFATGAAGIGLTAWRKRRKRKAVEQA